MLFVLFVCGGVCASLVKVNAILNSASGTISANLKSMRVRHTLKHTQKHTHTRTHSHAGTTTATVLTRAILAEGCKSVAAGDDALVSFPFKLQ
jgi:diacylglycerol kinase family enzyme